MSYIHLTKTELVFIEEYHSLGHSGRKIAKKLKGGFTALDIYLQYKENKSNCGRKKIELPASEIGYINDKVRQGWTQ